jgi:hypothetical protein
MSDHPTPTSNVSPFPGRDQDVAEIEELLERLLVTTVEADRTWSTVRERIGFDQDIAPLRPRRRSHRALALAIAAALMMSGVSLAALANQGQPSGHLRAPSGPGAQGFHRPPVRPGTGDEHPMPTPFPIDAGEPPTLAPSPDVGSQSPLEPGHGSDEQQGQDQHGGQDQGSSDQPTAQDQQQDQPDPTDAQSSADASADGNLDPSPSAQATDQQS